MTDPNSPPDETIAPPAQSADSQVTPQPTGEGTVDLTMAHSADQTGSHTVDEPGAKLGGRPRLIGHLPGYEILRELGRGGMGVVYQARHLKLNRLVAVKLMLNADHAGSAARERFDAEAQAVARLQHPNIVQVFEVGEADGVPFFSLEFVAGGTLAERVAKNLLPARETAGLMVTLSRAMQYAHDLGIIHRDLKPGNILLAGVRSQGSGVSKTGTAAGSSLTPDSCLLTPKITDFGLAKKIEENSLLTRAGAVVGTPSYMPPEQANGQQELVGPLADVYALGAILYDLLTGRPPFKGANVMDTLIQVRTKEPLAPSSLQPGVLKDLETICLKCLQKDPAKRYATAGELADDLQRFLDGVPIVARPIGAAERAWRWCKRNPRVAGLLATVAGLLLLIAGGAPAVAVVVNRQKNVIAEKEQTVARQRDEFKGLYESYRGAVDVFVNDAPGVLDGNPLTAGPNAELLALTTTLLENSQGKNVADMSLTDRGRLGIQIRKAEAAKAKALSNPAGVDPKGLDEAERLYAEALTLAEALDQPGRPERDKAAGNRAAILGSQAALRLLRRLTAADPAALRRQLNEAVRLHRLALEVEQRVLDTPESGEIRPGEVRTWLGRTHAALAEALQILALNSATADEARQHLLAGREHARNAEEHLTAGVASGELPPRVRTQARAHLYHAALEAGRAGNRLDDLDAADTGLKLAAERMGKLVEEFPSNLSYRQSLATAAAEYGDFLLLRRNDAAAAKKMYTLSVVHLRPLAQPPELARPVGNLALNYYRIATATLKTGDTPNALRLYGLCLETREAQLRDAERFAASRKESAPGYLLTAKNNAMLAQARVGKYREAAATAQELAAVTGNRRWQFQAACGFALSSAAVPGSDAGLQAEYRRRAFECLNRAIDAGYDDLATLERDPDLDPVRGDERFPAVLARVKALRAKK